MFGMQSNTRIAEIEYFITVEHESGLSRIKVCGYYF